MIHYLRPKELLFLSPWRPVETDTTPYEGQSWECPACLEQRIYFRSLARLEGQRMQFMVQCPTCDHLAVLHVDAGRDDALVTDYAGPHVDAFIGFLNAINRDRDALEE